MVTALGLQPKTPKGVELSGAKSERAEESINYNTDLNKVAEPYAPKTHCSSCEIKDEIIKQKEHTIRDLKYTIENLKNLIEQMQ